MKLVRTATGKLALQMKRSEWEQEWLKAEAKKKKKYEHSPTEHGFIEECIKKNPQAKDPGAYCASIVDKAKGTTEWRSEK